LKYYDNNIAKINIIIICLKVVIFIIIIKNSHLYLNDILIEIFYHTIFLLFIYTLQFKSIINSTFLLEINYELNVFIQLQIGTSIEFYLIIFWNKSCPIDFMINESPIKVYIQNTKKLDGMISSDDN